MKDDNVSNLIYSTDTGPVCPDCALAVEKCVCRAMKRSRVPVTSGKVRIRHETAGRRNKGTTIIYNLPLSQNQLEDLVRKLKSTFGTGGTVKEHTIELQGDQRAKVTVELRRLGYSI